MCDNMSEINMYTALNQSIEGESVDILNDDLICKDEESDNEDVPSFSNSQTETNRSFPRFACFNEFDENEVLIMHGQIKQLDKLSKKRYGILFQSKFAVFKTLEESVSKFQIPISCIKNVTIDEKNHEFKLELLTGKTYKYSSKNAKMWYDSINNLPKDTKTVDNVKKKVKVFLQDIKANRIFVAEKTNTIAYYDSEENLKYGIAIHRMKPYTLNVTKDTNKPILLINTLYRKYPLLFKSEEARELWFATIHQMVNDAISNPSDKTKAIKEMIYRNKSNRNCAECGCANPEWVSINLVITLCDSCAGLHRSISSYSAVRSINKDVKVWEDGLVAELFEKLGNDKALKFWMPSESNESQGVSKQFLEKKYIKRLYTRPVSELLEEYKVQNINDGLKQAILLSDLSGVMMFYHLGAAFDEISQLNKLINAFFRIQLRKNQPNNWRVEFFERCIHSELSDFSKRIYKVEINENGKSQMEFSVRKNYELRFNSLQTGEKIFVDIRNVSMVVKSIEEQLLTLFLSDTKLKDEDLNIIKIWCEDQNTDLDDLKVILAQRMCPIFEPRETFQCACWIYMSTAKTSWRPYFLVVIQNSLKFIDPLSSENNEDTSLTLDLRKMTQIKIESIPNMDTSCKYQAYNMASLNLVSNIIYHIRNETKSAVEELEKLLHEIRNTRDNSLQNESLTDKNVPKVVHEMVRYLHIRATGIEGPFRKAGRKQEAERIYQNMKRNATSFSLKDQDPYDVTSAFKLYFRRLSDPLLTQSLYKSWLAAISSNNREHNKRLVIENLNKLPEVNYKTLREIMFLLKEIVDNEETQLSSETLSISFNVTFMQTETEGRMAFDGEALKVLQYLIDNFYELFNVSEEEIEMQKAFKRALDKISNNPSSSSLILRHFYIEASLEKFIRNRNMEKSKWLLDQNEDLCQQLGIKSGWKPEDLRGAFFQSEETNFGVLLFEERKIVDYDIMEMVVYPQQILTDVIEISDKLNSLIENSICRFIIKFRPYLNLQLKSIPNPVSMQAYYYSNFTKKTTQARVEISVNHLHIWRLEVNELIESFPLTQITLYRPFQRTNQKYVFSVVFLKTYLENSPVNQNPMKILKDKFFIKNKFFNSITFQDKSNLDKFLLTYDKSKLYGLTPDDQKPNIARIT